jgi:hypothetical protein
MSIFTSVRWPRGLLGIRRGKYATLLTTLLALPILQALVDGFEVLEMSYWVAFVGMLVCASITVDRTGHAVWIGLLLGAPALIATAALPMTGYNVDHRLLVIVLVRTAIFITLLTHLGIEILRDVLHTQRVMFEQVCGGLCVYLMIGIIWGLGYTAIERIEPGAFLIDWTRYGLIDRGSPAQLNSLMLYFSFICLTTLGFGDVSPVTPLARGLVCVEAVLSQIYLAVFVARLVSQYLASGLMTITIENPPERPAPSDGGQGPGPEVGSRLDPAGPGHGPPHLRPEPRRTGREAFGHAPQNIG